MQLAKVDQKIDDTDKKILYELDRDARRSVKEIAKALKMNRDTVAYRISQLEKNKVIEGYYSVIDYSKIGYGILVRTYLRLQNATPEREEELIEYFVEQKETFTVFRTEGDWDIAIGFMGKTIHEFDSFYKKFLLKYRRYIYAQNISMFTDYLQYCKNYLVEPKSRDYTHISTGNSEAIKIDAVEFQILKLISKDAKLSLLDIANKLRLTSTAIKYRIRELEKKKIILGYKPLIDLGKIGYEYYKIDFEIEDLSKLKEFQSFAKEHPNIVYEDRTIGGSDFEFDIEIESHEKFYQLIDEFKRRFPEIIRTYKYYKARKIYKWSFFPE